jgi:hypothetical protein
MSLARSAPRFAAMLAAAVVAVLLISSGASRAHAQISFFIAYGVGLEPGDTVGFFIGDNWCGQVEADGEGQWLASIGPGAPELVCEASPGDLIRFKLNGVLTNVTEIYEHGGGPANTEAGVTLAGGDGGDAGSGTDTVPPVIEGPELVDYRLEAGQKYVHIDFNVEFDAFDAVDGPVDLFNDAPDLGFPAGKTWVHLWAWDSAENKAIREVLVVVVGDTTPPKIKAPELIERTVATLEDRVVLELADVIAIDDVDGEVPVFNDAPDAGFPVGKSWIRFWAVDEAGNEAVFETKVVVTVKSSFDGEGGVQGDIPPSGHVAFANAVGSSVPIFREALIAQNVKVAMVIREGRFVTFYPWAPDFVNAVFLDLFEAGVPHGEPMLIWAN